MIKHTDFQAAVNLAQSARRNAAYRRRDAGDPRNPFRAKAGREQEFLEATQSARAYGLILKLLEKEARRRTASAERPAYSSGPGRSPWQRWEWPQRLPCCDSRPRRSRRRRSLAYRSPWPGQSPGNSRRRGIQ